MTDQPFQNISSNSGIKLKINNESKFCTKMHERKNVQNPDKKVYCVQLSLLFILNFAYFATNNETNNTDLLNLKKEFICCSQSKFIQLMIQNLSKKYRNEDKLIQVFSLKMSNIFHKSFPLIFFGFLS